VVGLVERPPAQGAEVKVIDASGLAALTFAEADAERVIDAIDVQTLAAPFLLPFELTNVARKKMRLRPDALNILGEQLRDGLALSVALMEVDHIEVLTLAAALSLSASDASYVWLARALGADLVTLDRKLDAAARRRRT